MKKSLSLIGCCLALATMPAAAIQYTLGVGNTGAGGLSPTYPGPYGTVDVSLNDSTHALVTFTGGASGGYTYLFGGAQAIDVNVNGAFTISTASITGMTSPSVTSGNVSMFGSFNATIDNFDGNGAAGSPMSFVITLTSGTWASAGSVLVNNSDGYLAAAHIFVRDATGANPATGFAGNGGSSRVPDGGMTMLMLGSGLAALGAIARRFKK